MAKVALAEDDLVVAKIVQAQLVVEHHAADLFSTGSKALLALQDLQYDLAIVSNSLPDVGGIEICARFRSTGGSTPLLVLIDGSESKERIAALNAGADGCLIKPFDLDELSAWVRALLRRPFLQEGCALTLGDLRLEPTTGLVVRNGREIRLAPKEFALLEFFMQHPNEVVSTDVLLDSVWASDSDATPLLVRVCVNRVRSKIDVPGEISLIRNLHGLGYKLVASDTSQRAVTAEKSADGNCVTDPTMPPADWTVTKP